MPHRLTRVQLARQLDCPPRILDHPTIRRLLPEPDGDGQYDALAVARARTRTPWLRHLSRIVDTPDLLRINPRLRIPDSGFNLQSGRRVAPLYACLPDRDADASEGT